MDLKTLDITLDNVIDNFMNCSNMMIGRMGKYCITFKTNQKSFDIWRRNHKHSFNANLNQDDLDDAIGLPLETMNAFLVGKDDQINFYDTQTYKKINTC